MKTKDTNWYNQKIESIRKRKRKLYLVEDPRVRKRIKEDLKREQRGVKRAERQYVDKLINEEVDKLDIQY
jgi:hypothetical protein